jgi:hypothetical protein
MRTRRVGYEAFGPAGPAVDPLVKNPRQRKEFEAIGLAEVHAFFVGSFFRLVLAKSLSCFSDMDLAISFDAPLRLDLLVSPRLAANAAPAAICCFFDFAGILPNRGAGDEWMYLRNLRSTTTGLRNRDDLGLTEASRGGDPNRLVTPRQL